MKMFNLNILTDEQLNEIKSKCTYKSFLDYLKIKKIYRVWCNYVDQPKCDKCNENRQYEIILPDGEKVVKDCSCKKQKPIYQYGKVDLNSYSIIIHKFNNEIYLMKRDEYDDSYYYRLDALNNLKNPKYGNLYTTEAKAKKAVKILNKSKRS